MQPSVSRGWSGYLQDLFNLPQAFFGEENSTVNLGAVAIALVLGTIAAVGIRESKLVTNALVVIKVSVSVFVIVSRHLLPQGRQPDAVHPAEPAGVAARPGSQQPLWQFVSGVDPAAFGVAGVLRRRRRRVLRLQRLRGGRQPR